MNKTRFLSKVSIFSQIKESYLQQIAEQSKYQEFFKGEMVIHEGEYGNKLFIIIKGQVEAIKNLGKKNEKIMGVFGPYCYFGEMALIDNLERSVSVVAKDDVQVLSLEQLDLHREIEKSPPMAFELLQMLSRRVRASEKFILQTLGTLLPICANCQRIREDNGAWTSIEEYIREHSETEFSHGLCPECTKKLYPLFCKGD